VCEREKERESVCVGVSGSECGCMNDCVSE
jgi:hypothetical protein